MCFELVTVCNLGSKFGFFSLHSEHFDIKLDVEGSKYIQVVFWFLWDVNRQTLSYKINCNKIRIGRMKNNEISVSFTR